MVKGGSGYKRLAVTVLSILMIVALNACDSTKHLKEGEYLLRRNSVKIKSPQPITKRGELNDNIERLAGQKPNKYWLWMPIKLWLYNNRYEKYQTETDNFQVESKTVEPPVVYDSTVIPKAMQNMRGYLYNQGYFYAQIHDTTVFKGKKAYVTYDVQTGINYLINERKYDIQDTMVKAFILAGEKETVLKKGVEYSKSLVDEERRRIVVLLQNKGYYKFSADNISFLIDTFNKSYLNDIDNPFESAINFVALQKNEKNPTLDVKIIVRADEDPAAFNRFGVKRVTVYPDFIDVKDVRDTTMLQRKVGKTLFKYHNYYVSEKVLHKSIYLEPDRYYSLTEYNETINKLNELGIFNSINIYLREDSTDPNWLICGISMSPAKKHDFSTNIEVTSGSTYTLGNAASISFRDKNIGKGANFLRMSVSGGIESLYDNDRTGTTLEKFFLRTTYYGFNTSLDFPKFLVPFNINSSRRNLPRTILSFGSNLMNRINYFTLVNTTAGISYNWKETITKSWEISPAFINIIRLPSISDSFRLRLSENQFLANSYKESFIEGQNVAFIYSNREKMKGKSYSYARLGVEEAGGVMSGIQSIGRLFNDSFNLNYFQYVKFDFDLQHFVIRPHASLATRFYGGIGIPYGGSSTLPYTKQYYVGGAYSLRGWRVRTLGPGSSVDTTGDVLIDRTGDIKLEFNTEYRYDIVRLFSGAINIKGALFADAGNIWLANKSTSYPGGEFAFNKLGKDVALDMGTGIRMDIAGFFLLRLDLAVPVKKPYVSGNNGWVFRQIDFGDNDWRSNNLIFNFAIGYPF